MSTSRQSQLQDRCEQWLTQLAPLEQKLQAGQEFGDNDWQIWRSISGEVSQAGDLRHPPRPLEEVRKKLALLRAHSEGASYTAHVQAARRHVWDLRDKRDEQGISEAARHQVQQELNDAIDQLRAIE